MHHIESKALSLFGLPNNFHFSEFYKHKIYDTSISYHWHQHF